jgi:hypothetical protein
LSVGLIEAVIRIEDADALLILHLDSAALAPSRRRPERAGPGSAIRQSDGKGLEQCVAAEATAVPGEVGPSYRLFGILPPRMGGVVVHAFIRASLACSRARESPLGGRKRPSELTSDRLCKPVCVDRRVYSVGIICGL